MRKWRGRCGGIYGKAQKGECEFYIPWRLAGGQEGMFLLWQYERAKKALNTYNRRIADLKDFIEVAKRELEKKGKEAAGHEKDNADCTM